MKLDMALGTQGWLSANEIVWLAEQASKHKKILEIGSYLGRSTRALADNTDGVVYAIDDFSGPRDMELPQILRENIFNLYRYNVGDLILSGKLITIVADHRTIELDTTFDMVFIDGSHEYLDVQRDIEKWLPKIKEGGIICGHDITNLVDVRMAVTDKFKEYNIAKDTSIWYVKL